MTKSEKQGKLVDAGFDWLTLTSNPKRPEYEQFKCTALDFIRAMENSGCQVKETRAQGYDGFQVAETFFGTRADSAMWRTSGNLARHVAAFAKANRLTPNVTRADLQQTIEQPRGDTGELARILGTFSRCSLGSEAPQSQKFATFHDSGCVIGSTFGARSSSTYLRCYRADIRHPEKFALPALRYEAEWKAERANQLWKAYQIATDDVTLSCAYVGGEFLAKNIMQPIHADFAPCRLPPLGRRTTDEKTVYWIQTTVCKSIARLVKAGYAKELTPHIMAALCPAPDVSERSATLEASIQEIDWEVFENARDI